MIASSKWQHINTDGMALRTMDIQKSPQKNIPYLDQIVLQPNQYLNEIVEGFRLMYLFLMENCDALPMTTLLDDMSE